MQARFFRQLLERGLTPDDLVQSYGVTVGQIEDWIRADAVYRLACLLDFSEDVKAKVNNNRDFPLSTLERLVESQAIRDFLMLKPDPKELLVSTAKPGDFLEAFRTIVTDVATGKIDSRAINNAEDIATYVKTLNPFKPAPRSRGKFSVREHLSQTEQPSPTVSTQAKPSRQLGKSPSVLPKGLKCFCSDSRVNDIFDELKHLRLDKSPNASAVMLRLLLEFSVSYYLDTTGQIKPLLEHFRKKDNKGADWYPSLRQLMDHLLKLDIGLQPLEIKALNKFVQTKGQNNTLDALDGFVHNRKVEPTEVELRVIVKLIDPLLRVTLGGRRNSKAMRTITPLRYPGGKAAQRQHFAKSWMLTTLCDQ